MAIILESWKDIAGDDYADFLDMALDWFGFFSIVWRDTSSFDDSAVLIRRDLERHEVVRRRASHWPGTRTSRTANTPKADIITFRLDVSSRQVLARPGSLFSWVAPRYPEDLAFYHQEGRLAFATVSHERMAWAIDRDFGCSLPKRLEFTERESELAGDGGFEYVAS
ncbi:MAG TPA: hypothetical protein VNT99_02085 [Methylomirabilota bacterium]|nr:hypothetical protein [Methylomirabilota bacterium]